MKQEILEEGRMLRQQDRDSALEFYEYQRQKAAISHDEELWLTTTLTLAWELLESGQNDRGLIEQTLSVAKPDNPYLLLTQGRALMATGKFLEAIPLLQTTTTTDDLEVQGLLSDALGQCFGLSHQFERAKSQYDRAIALLSPDSFYLGFTHLHLGEMHLFMQDFDQSEESAQLALELSIQQEDQLLRFNALILLTQIALRRGRIEVANALIEDAQQLIDPQLDCQEVVKLTLLQMEALVQEDIDSALALWEHFPPLLDNIQNWLLKQQAKYIQGKLGIVKIAEGIVTLSEDVVENLEDLLLELGMDYEERGMLSFQALVLLDMAQLYSYALKLPTPYQFQGKSIRSVEQAGQLLQSIGLGDTQLGRDIERCYDLMLDQLSFKHR